MKNFLLSLMSIFTMVALFSCTSPSSGLTSSEVTKEDESSSEIPVTPHVTADDLKNTAYAGQRSQWQKGETDKFLYVVFKSTSSGENVTARVGKGMTADEAKTNAQNGSGQFESVTIQFPLTLILGHSMTIYMEKDLQSGYTLKKVYVGNSIAHVKDAVLYKQ